MFWILLSYPLLRCVLFILVTYLFFSTYFVVIYQWLQVILFHFKYFWKFGFVDRLRCKSRDNQINNHLLYLQLIWSFLSVKLSFKLHLSFCKMIKQNLFPSCITTLVLKLRILMNSVSAIGLLLVRHLNDRWVDYLNDYHKIL